MSMSKMSKTTVAIGFLCLAMTACGTTKPMSNLGVKQFYAQSDEKRPVWIDHEKKWAKEHPKNMYFVGVSSNNANYEIGRIDAKMQAFGSIATRIKSTVHALYVGAITTDSADRKGTDVALEQSIERGLTAVAYGVITGAKVDDYFWKKYQVQTEPGGPVYSGRDVYAIVEMSPADYKRTVFETLSKTKEKVKDPRAKALVQKMEKKWTGLSTSAVSTVK